MQVLYQLSYVGNDLILPPDRRSAWPARLASIIAAS
jgi:hypothetical protein